ncbi:MAG: hypothetical protein SGI91_12840 [Alphaproteobacteria bacterium]|jgi:hypothetical protein|nr:hypothetical protein [Alphaproteobacteria bacterium]
MANIHTPKVPQPGPDITMGGVLGLGGGVLGLVALGIAFEASVWAGAVLLVAAVVAVFFAVLAGSNAERVTPPVALLLAAAVWSLLAGLIVFEWHWLAFTPAAWVFDALFVAALVAGAWKNLKAWAKFLAALTAAALVTATMVVPRPPGGDGALDTVEKWTVDVEVADKADGTPLEGARVLCGTVMQWDGALALADTMARTSGRDGKVETWEFDEDPRLKIVICNAWKDANDGNAGYPAQTQVVLAPAGGGEYKLSFALDETAHPDTAYLTFDLSGAFAEQPWYYLTFEVWDGEPQSGFGDRTGPQPIARKQWGEIRGGGFTLPVADAARDLTLRYRYEGPNGPELGPPASEEHTLQVGPIAAGSRRRLSLTIPTPRAE